MKKKKYDIRSKRAIVALSITLILICSGCINESPKYDNTRATIHRFMVNDPLTDNDTILINLIERECNSDAPVWNFNATRCKETLISEAIGNRDNNREDINTQREGINKLLEKHRKEGNLSEEEYDKLDGFMEQPKIKK